MNSVRTRAIFLEPSPSAAATFDIYNEFMEIVGEISYNFTGGIYYEIFPKHRRKGYATMALRELVSNLKEIGYHPYLLIPKGNIESKGVARKANFYPADESERLEKWLSI